MLTWAHGLSTGFLMKRRLFTRLPRLGGNTFWTLLLACVLLAAGMDASAMTTSTLWVQPSTMDGKPLWGHVNGIRVGLPTTRGPFGLLYLYMPGVTQKENAVLNFLAIEPVVGKVRCLSELETSTLDQRNGKRFWSEDSPSFTPRDPARPANGVLQSHGTTETLQVYIMTEKFVNGAQPYLRLTFRSDLPGEVQVETFSAPGSAPMRHCIVTATMGNYARLRQLWLKEGTTSSLALWPTYREMDFAPAREFGLKKLWRATDGTVLVAATCDEAAPEKSKAPGHWNYTGKLATQYWRVEPDQVSPRLLARVNGRYVYWMSHNPLPGGIAFENMELQLPYREGERYSFGVTTQSVERLREELNGALAGGARVRREAHDAGNLAKMQCRVKARRRR